MTQSTYTVQPVDSSRSRDALFTFAQYDISRGIMQRANRNFSHAMCVTSHVPFD